MVMPGGKKDWFWWEVNGVRELMEREEVWRGKELRFVEEEGEWAEDTREVLKTFFEGLRREDEAAEVLTSFSSTAETLVGEEEKVVEDGDEEEEEDYDFIEPVIRVGRLDVVDRM
jgi:hypothetical protein